MLTHVSAAQPPPGSRTRRSGPGHRWSRARCGGRPGCRGQQGWVWEAGRGRGGGAPEVHGSPWPARSCSCPESAAGGRRRCGNEGLEGHAGSGPGQRGQQLPGLRSGGLVLASAPHTVRPRRPPAGPHAKPPGKTEPPRQPRRFPGSRAPAGGGQDATSWPCQTLHDPGEPGLLLPRCSSGPCHAAHHPPPQTLALTGPQESSRAALALAAHGTCHAGAVSAGVHVPALSPEPPAGPGARIRRGGG